MVISSEICDKLRDIKIIILDVDGVMTDGSIWLGAHEELKRFHVRDGAGIKYLLRSGINVAFVTGRTSEAVARRARELGISECLQGCHQKLPVFQELLQRLAIPPSEAACMGDDLMDIPLMRHCGVAIAPADAVPEARNQAHIVTTAGGGHGAVREAAEIILKARGDWDGIVERYFEA